VPQIPSPFLDDVEEMVQMTDQGGF